MQPYSGARGLAIQMGYKNCQARLGGSRLNRPRHLQASPVPLDLRRLENLMKPSEFSGNEDDEFVG